MTSTITAIVRRPFVNVILAAGEIPRVALGVLLLALALSVGRWMTGSLALLADEPHHFEQIRLLMRGQWQLVPLLTTIPGYHAIIAVMGYTLGSTDVTILRICSFGLSLAALGTIFALARTAGDGRAVERLLQIAFLPILFPLFFLLYTDVAAVLFLSLALLLNEKSRHMTAAVAATAALAVRQNYILWFVFAALLLAVELTRARAIVDGGSAPTGRAARGIFARATHWALIRKELGYGIGLVVFAAFVLWNGGVAVGDRTMHPFPSLHLGNVYFALFLSFFLLLPLHVVNAQRLAALASRPLTLGALAAILVLFLLTFAPDHPYNQPALNWWLHNRLLTWLSSSFWTKLAMFVAMAIALLSFAVTALRDRSHYLVYPFAVLSLLPAWQIEQRYYLMPLILFLLYRRQRSLAFEWSLIAYLAVFTAVLLLGIASRAYFL